MRAVLLALAVSTGCDKLFGLADINDPAVGTDALVDVGGDGVRIDAPVDAVIQTHSNCPNDFFGPFENSQYRYFGTYVTWYEAHAACAALKDPTSTKHVHLAVLSSDLERTHVYVDVQFSASAFWIGLSDTATEGTMQWVTDETVSYPTSSAWQAGEPHDEPEDDCVRVEHSNADLVALSCDSQALKTPYVCECDAFPYSPDNYSLQ